MRPSPRMGHHAMSLVSWIAAAIMICNVLMLFPTAFWWLTGTMIVPFPLVRQFDPNREANLFTWYSSLLLIVTSISALVNFGLDSLRTEEARWKRYAWLWLCAVILFLSMDEVATVHETVDRLVRQQLRGAEAWPAWVMQYGKTWIIAYTPGILIVVGSFLFVFRRLWRESHGIALFAMAGLTLWLGAIGLEFSQADLCQELGETEMKPRCLEGEILFEEGCEILGTTSLLVAFVWYANARVTALVSTVRFPPETN